MTQPKDFNISKMPRWGKVVFVLVAVCIMISMMEIGQRLLGVDFVKIFGNPLVLSSVGKWLGVVFVVGIAVIVMHEGFHGLAIHICGAKAKFGFKWISSFGLVFYTTTEMILSRYHYQAICLAPQALSVLAIIVLAFVSVLPPILIYCLLVFVVLNIGGGFGDFYIYYLLEKYPSSTMFVDTMDGFKVVGWISQEPREVR